MWREVHARLERLARDKAAYDADEAHWLVEAVRLRVHERLGFGSPFEYLERLFGYEPRLARERLRVAEALTELPLLREALAANVLSWSAVRELSRIAVAETEAKWLADARGKTVRQVEQMVSGRKRGDPPGGDPPAPVTRHVLRLEISSDSLAAFREARNRLELEVGHSLEDDDVVRLMARAAIGGEDDPGRAPYQVAVTVCSECGRGTRDGAGRALPLEDDQVEAARCDAQEVAIAAIHVGHGRTTHVGSARATQTIPPAVRRLVWRRDGGRCQVPGCRAAKHLEVHHIVARSDGGTHEPFRMTILCSAHHRLLHRGALRIEGTAPDGLAFHHADGRRYGEAPARRDLAMEKDAFDGLRRMGVAASDARRAVLHAAASNPSGIEDLLRQALAFLHRNVYASAASETSPGA